ncbi:unnamed protein product [Cylindrotheca closterium]|uniref:Uncharacterized protein n=1 Tax=Cylindrotheca closterium TaxID=2856 RepID=A0AAD2CGZ9_9STRA|nr:unnamed protein product [Cylindrotheca closterium]
MHLNPSDAGSSVSTTISKSSPFAYSIASILDLDSSRDNFLATQVWPSARVAAQALLRYDPNSRHGGLFANDNNDNGEKMASSTKWKMCEFGCGPGLPSLAAAHTNHYSQVVATDLDEFCLELVQAAAKDQGLEHVITTQVLDLTKDPKMLLGLSTTAEASEGDDSVSEINAASSSSSSPRPLPSSYAWMKDIDLFVMADIFENSQVAKGAAAWTKFLMNSSSLHRPRIWVFAQSDRAQREIYLETLKEICGMEAKDLKWLPLEDCNENDSLWLVDLDETQVQYG